MGNIERIILFLFLAYHFYGGAYAEACVGLVCLWLFAMLAVNFIVDFLVPAIKHICIEIKIWHSNSKIIESYWKK